MLQTVSVWNGHFKNELGFIVVDWQSDFIVFLIYLLPKIPSGWYILSQNLFSAHFRINAWEWREEAAKVPSWLLETWDTRSVLSQHNTAFAQTHRYDSQSPAVKRNYFKWRLLYRLIVPDKSWIKQNSLKISLSHYDFAQSKSKYSAHFQFEWQSPPLWSSIPREDGGPSANLFGKDSCSL